jgi:hypothetical protein
LLIRSELEQADGAALMRDLQRIAPTDWAGAFE